MTAKPKKDANVQTAIRLPEAFLARLDKIAERMSEPGMQITRAEALRLAAFKGAEQLEADLGKKKR